MRLAVVFAALLSIGHSLLADSPGEVTLAVKDRVNSAPWIAAAGSFVAVAWGAAVNGKGDVYIAVSRDGGQTFGQPVQVNAVAGEARIGGEIPPRVELLAAKASTVPEIAVLWNARGETTAIKTSRSRDGGRTFEAPVAMQAAGAPGDRGWPALALDQQGVAHAIWLDHRGLAGDRMGGHAGHKSAREHDGVAMAQRSGLYYAAAGESSLRRERELFKGVCYCCKTALSVGPDGALYAAWRHVYQGNIRDIAFTVSRDGGRSFSVPVRVSEDKWELNGCPDDGPAMVVDSKGTVHLVWPTVIGGANPEGALFYASSRDGRSFTPRLRVPTLGSPKPSHPQIAVDSAGRVVVAWDEAVNGRRMAAARVLNRDTGQGLSFGEPITLAAEGASTYPVLAATDRGVIAVWTTGGDSSVVRARQLPLR
jgi:hypothetical protein